MSGDVWVYANQRLLRYGADGQQKLDVALAGNPLVGDLLVDNAQQQIWIAGAYTVSRYSFQGQFIAKRVFPSLVRGLSRDVTRNTLWVATLNALYVLDASGAELRKIPMGWLEVVNALAFDPALDQAWVVVNTVLRRYDPNGQKVFQSGIPLPLLMNRLAPDGRGGAWVSGPVYARHFTAEADAGVLLRPFQGYANTFVVDQTADTVDGSVWFANERTLKHYSLDGALLHEFEPELGDGVIRHLRGLAMSADAQPPTVSINAPAAGAYLNDATPAIAIDYEAAGSGIDTDSLEVQIDGVAVAVICAFAADNAQCELAAPLTDGAHTVSVTVADAAGNRSAPAESAFHIDTVAPVLTVVTPADGLVTNLTQLIVSGSVNEPSDVVINTAGTALDANNAFSSAAALVEGVNDIHVSATDRAGNHAEVSRSVTLDTTPPAIPAVSLITIHDPVDGMAAIVGQAGSVEPGSTVIITNRRTGEQITVTADANGALSASIAAVLGDTMAVVAADTVGNDSAPADSHAGRLPPDPATVAPEIDAVGFVSAHELFAFLYSGANPVQTGVAADTIQPLQAAVLRGQVTDRSGAPIAGVKVTVHGHPEFGQTLTRADGLFDLVVNGGGMVTVNYDREGYLSVQRQVTAPWQDYAWLPGVVMIPLDAEVTHIDLASGAAAHVARGSEQSDVDGARRATLIIPGGTQASLVMADGTTQAISTLGIRATEYTVGATGPQAMPGALPPTSGYTYAVEYSVDEALAAGAVRVQFDRPVYHYVENFLDFPVGEPVPVGYYDRDMAAWVPSEDGRIIEILSIDGGVAQVDVDGSGQAASAQTLAELGFSQAELAQLANLYSVGQTLWRAPITHFTPWDCNWPYGPPDDAIPPPSDPPEGGDDKPEDPNCKSNSIIECESQVLGESIPLVGTPLTLNYRSDRVAGRLAEGALRIPLSGDSVPPTLRRIELEIKVAGRLYRYVFDPQPNLVHPFNWDGRDAYGRAISGRISAKVKITYVYGAVYYGGNVAAGFSRSFSRLPSNGGGTGGATAIVGRSREASEVYSIFEWQAAVGVPVKAPDLGFGGWSVDIHHAYDPLSRTLIMGNGQRREAKNLGETVRSFHGWPSGISINLEGLALEPQGSLIVAVPSQRQIFRVVSSAARISIVGTGAAGSGGDNGPATLATLNNPVDVALGPDGSIYIADASAHRVRRVTPDGLITTFAGTGTAGSLGDEGSAAAAQLNTPSGLAVAADGTLYIADTANHRIRAVSPDGVIWTLAGDGTAGFSGDGSLATQARLNSPVGLSVGHDGSLYVADRNNHRIRRIRPDGVISTVAGNGSPGYSGDGSAALQTSLNSPNDIAVTPSGELYIADRGNNRLRKVDAKGVISTYAGGGGDTPSGFSTIATDAALLHIASVAMAPNGLVYLAGADVNRRHNWVVGRAFDGYTGDDITIVSEDGEQLYRFSPTGRHLRTLSALTGRTLYEFGYTDGRLTSITDANGNVTAIERRNDGVPSSVTGPYGQSTDFTVDENGFLSSVTNMADEAYMMSYTNSGLLTLFRDPKHQASHIEYDTGGRLLRDENPAGGVYSLSRSELDEGYAVDLVSPLGRINRYSRGPPIQASRGRSCSRTVLCATGSFSATAVSNA